MEKSKETFKKQRSKIFMGGLFLAMAFLVIGVGVVEKVNANDGPSVTITSPNGGELLESNSSHLITWTQTNVDKVSLSACYGVGSATCELIVSSLETNGNTGSYNWNMPSDLLKRADYKISVIAWQTGVGTNSDKSDEVFTIGDNTTSMDYSIQLLSQTTNETWEVGNNYVIQWSNSNPDYIKEMNISLATVDGTKWHTFDSVDSIKGQTNYSTTIVAPIMDGSDYKVKLRGEKAYNGYLTETVSSDGFVNLLSTNSNDTTPPSPPTNISAFFGGDNTSISINWTTPNDSDFSHLVIYQSSSKNVLGKLLYNNLSEGYIGKSSGLSFKIANQGLVLGNTYYYTIHSVDTNGNESTNTDQYAVTLIPSEISPTESTVEVSPNNVVADGQSIANITVTIKGERGDLLNNKLVNLSSSRESSDKITKATLFTGVDGRIIFSVSSSVAGTSTYTATTNGIELSETVQVVFTDPINSSTCLPDNTLLKLPNDPKIYVIRNCEKHWIRTAEEFKRGGYKWENIKISTSDVINSFPEVFESEEIKEGAIIKVRGGIDIYIVKYIGNKKFIRLILNPSVFNSYGHLKWEDVIEVEKETIDSFVTSNLVRNAETGKIYRLTANGDNGTRRHFQSISVMQRLGYDLDAVYEINRTDENSYEQGDDLE